MKNDIKSYVPFEYILQGPRGDSWLRTGSTYLLRVPLFSEAVAPRADVFQSLSLCLVMLPLTLLSNDQAGDKLGNKTYNEKKVDLWKCVQSYC